MKQMDGEVPVGLTRHLEQVYPRLLLLRDYPTDSCNPASNIIAGPWWSLLRLKFGLEVVQGGFKLDKIYHNSASKGFISRGHHWVVDREARIYDGTGHQFDPWLDEPFPQGKVVVLRPEDKNYGRYISWEDHERLNQGSDWPVIQLRKVFF